MRAFKNTYKWQLTVFVLSFLLYTCNNSNPDKELTTTSDTKSNRSLSNEFKGYWYSGEAEITSYELEQARYGEIRKGHAVLIYVTEDFNPIKQVKSDQLSEENVSVLKLNATKKFVTGIYPYSIMQSTFYPLDYNDHALKVTSSIQEWCGQVYAQLNSKEQFELDSHSYFESEADQQLKLDKNILENELWTQLRIDPSKLPIGNLQVIPSLEYTRMQHVEIKAYKGEARLFENTYTLYYPDLERKIAITFQPEFPYTILSWEENFKSGFGNDAKMLTTKATRLKTIKSSYWNKNKNADSILRKTLLLK